MRVQNESALTEGIRPNKSDKKSKGFIYIYRLDKATWRSFYKYRLQSIPYLQHELAYPPLHRLSICIRYYLYKQNTKDTYSVYFP